MSGQRSGEASLAAIELGVDDERRCPHCGSGGAVSRGKARALRRFPCKARGKTFGALTGTPLSGLHHKERWLSLSEALTNGKTIRRLPSAAELRRARHSAGATACWRRFGKHRIALAASSRRTRLLCLRARRGSGSWSPSRAGAADLGIRHETINRSAGEHSSDIGLVWGPIDDQSLGVLERFPYGHCRVSSGADTEIRHALLPFSDSRRADRTVNIRCYGD